MDAVPAVPVRQQRSQSPPNRHNQFLALLGTFFTFGELRNTPEINYEDEQLVWKIAPGARKYLENQVKFTKL